jgi:ethanolamine utilization protein EutA
MATNAQVLLAGLDFGSTTSGFFVAEAQVGASPASGRRTVTVRRVVFRSDPVFTPFQGDLIDEAAIERLLDAWLTDSGLRPEAVFAGGAIVTGLAAQRRNAAVLGSLVRRRIGDMVMATAGDPCLESWLAFMGGCAPLSRAHPDRPFVNLDIGGGTTNAAFGRNGAVLATGCHFIGARHLRFQPGTYRLIGRSPYAASLLTELGIDARDGVILAARDRARLLAYYVAGLEAIVRGDRSFFDTPAGRRHQQVPFTPPSDAPAEITFTGGVGALLYRLHAGEPLPDTTHYGDLGIDLARAIAASPPLSRSLDRFVPEHRGRATVYGLTLHSTDVSGASLYLPRAAVLPLRDLPILARVGCEAPPDAFSAAFALAGRHHQGGCVQVSRGPASGSAAGIKALGDKLAEALGRARIPADRVLVVLVEDNIGKAVGNYATGWGKSPANLIVIDEVPDRHADFVTIGRVRDNMVPVSFFGMH